VILKMDVRGPTRRITRIADGGNLLADGHASPAYQVLLVMHVPVAVAVVARELQPLPAELP
jgi:hypothetical protein